ncbi:TPA: MarR family transcriptional regulator [Acinetobacter baumannii]|nr:MarR family transcriptional regulator [Acinetobacter baumannii]
MMDQYGTQPDFLFSRDSIALACTRAREAVVSNFSEHLNRWEITEQQWRIIRILHDTKKLSLTDLCKESCIHKASMTRIIANLLDKGWVLREKDPSDSRSISVSLTEAGEKFVIEAKEIGNQIYADIYKKYGYQKTKLLLEMLNDLESVRK